MNRSAIKLLAMTLTSAALAVSAAHATPSQWLGENVPFDGAADEPQPVEFVSGSMTSVSAPTTRADASKYLGENVPFDDAADAPVQFASASTSDISGSHGGTSKWLGENVPFDATASDEPGAVAFEENYPDSTSELAGLLLDLPADSYSETTFPLMSDYVIDEAPLMTASLDPLNTP